MNIFLLSTRKFPHHVSYNTVLGLENEFLTCNECKGIITFSRFYSLIDRGAKKVSGGTPDYSVIRKITSLQKEDKVFYAAMGLHSVKQYKETLKRIGDRLIIYVFDCWESEFSVWESLLKDISPYSVFFAYKKAAKFFEKRFSNVFYMPQSMDADYYHERDTKKKRLFIQMGRRNERLHECVLSYLSEHNISDSPDNYLFVREKGKILFPEIEELVNAIAESYFFIVAPQNVENNSLTGSISEVTARFYEAMACKTLIVGIKPEDSFDELFPYKDAMIEVNKDNFSEKVDYLLSNNELYREIVDRNYNYVMQNHRWRNRFQTMICTLDAGTDLA